MTKSPLLNRPGSGANVSPVFAKTAAPAGKGAAPATRMLGPPTLTRATAAPTAAPRKGGAPTALRPPASAASAPAGDQDAERYLKAFPDVAAAIAAGHFGGPSNRAAAAWKHYELHGRAIGRPWGAAGEAGALAYLKANPDVMAAIRGGAFGGPANLVGAAHEHYHRHGRAEKRAWGVAPVTTRAPAPPAKAGPTVVNVKPALPALNAGKPTTTTAAKLSPGASSSPCGGCKQGKTGCSGCPGAGVPVFTESSVKSGSTDGKILGVDKNALILVGLGGIVFLMMRAQGAI